MVTASTESSVERSGEASYRRKYHRLQRLVALVAQGSIHSIFVSGQPGISKTTTVLKTLAELGLEEKRDYFIAKGRASPLGIYTQLASEVGSNRILIFDDCDSALNKDGVNLIKAALDDKDRRTVSFMSSRLPPGVPPEIEFTGRIIFISNLKVEAIDPAIASRCHNIELNLSRDELYDFIEYEVLQVPHASSTRSQRQYVLWRLKSALRMSPATPSVRLYKKLLDLWCHDRSNFNDHVEALVPRSDDLSMLRQLLDRNDTVGEAAREFARITGKSERSFYLLKAKFRDCL